MHEADVFLKALSVVLCVAAVTTVLFQRLKQPVVLGYILAGLVVGPHLPIPLVADEQVVTTLSELGVILLMFALGLEFRFKTLLKVGPSAAITAIVETSIMLWLGFSVGRLFGWTQLESLFCGSVVAISSTTIIARAFGEQGITGPLKELVLGILIVEDLIAIVLMTTLTAVSSGSGLSAIDLAITVGKLAAFLAGLLVVGVVVVPRSIRRVVASGSTETVIVASIGVCFAVSALAREFEYSAALGAFIAGSLVAESGHGEHIEHSIRPVRDVFAAIFFVSVGMHINPTLVLDHWQPTAVLVAVVLVGKSVGVSFGAFLTSGNPRVSVQAGMTLSQIGEFSFIIAGLGMTLGVTRPFLYPVVVIVSALTTLTTPYMIRASTGVAARLQHTMPKPLQTFTSLYASWLEQLTRARPRDKTSLRRLVRLLVVDSVLLVAMGVAATVFSDAAREKLLTLGISGQWAGVVQGGVIAIVVVPLVAGLVTVARRLGRTLAARVLPDGEVGRLDLMATPRKVLVVSFELTLVVLVGAPLVAVTQPFLPGAAGLSLVVVFAIVVMVLGVSFWRSAADLQGHVRAGAEVLVAALVEQARAGPSARVHAPTIDQIDLGLGRPLSVQLGGDSPALGKSLVDLDLRVATGASALAIIRDGVGDVPTGHEVLRVGDILALSGTREAISAAAVVLTGTALPITADGDSDGDDVPASTSTPTPTPVKAVPKKKKRQ